MSDSSAATPTGPASPQVVAYLTSQLARNPIHQSGDIVSHRAKAFKLAPVQSSPAAAVASASSDQRPKLRKALEDLRSRSFTASVEESLASIDKLDLAPFPDLAALADRLRVILKSRSALPQLSGHPKFDGDFFSCLKKVLVSPPRDVSVLREQVLASFRHRKNRKRGQAMVKLLKAELPELYALESDWLESLLRRQPSPDIIITGAPREKAEESNENFNWKRWLFVFLVCVLVRGYNRLNDEESTTRQPAPRSSATNSRAPQAPTAAELIQQEDNVRRGAELIQNRLEQNAFEEAERQRRERFLEGEDEETRIFSEDAWRESDSLLRQSFDPDSKF